jgi:hypothetical protein
MLNKEVCKKCVNETRLTNFGPAKWDNYDEKIWKKDGLVVCPNTRVVHTEKAPPCWCCERRFEHAVYECMVKMEHRKSV